MTNSGKYLIVGFLGIVAGGVLGSVVEIITGDSNSGMVGIFGLIGGGIAVWRLARRGHLHNLGNNCAVGWAYFRYVRQTAGPADWGFAYGPGGVGVRSRVELRFPTGPTAHHRHRIRNDSPDHHGGVGRQLTA